MIYHATSSCRLNCCPPFASRIPHEGGPAHAPGCCPPCVTVRSNTEDAACRCVSIRARLTSGRPCLRPTRRPPASNSGRRSCLPAAPLSGCCRFGGCSPGSQTLKNADVGAGASCGSSAPLSRALVLLKILRLRNRPGCRTGALTARAFVEIVLSALPKEK